MVELSGRTEKEGVEGNGKGISYATSSSSPVTYDGNSLRTRKATPISSYYFYPQPLAKYEDVVANAKLFMDTLGKLHASMRTKFMIPVIGGKELDLHQLFVEVTSRGGIEKVMRERRWKEVKTAFSFPSTATNASFVLRKYYVSLIHHYEQIYYFKAKGCSTAPPGTDTSITTTHSMLSLSSLPIPIPCPSPHEPTITQSSELAATTYSGQKRTRNTEEVLNEAFPSLGGHVVGVIDAKFEHGYLVTVTLGSETLKGVLYHIPEQPINHVQNSSCITKNTTTPTTVHRRRRRKKSEMKKRDPDHPKPNRSGYSFFFQEQHPRLKPLYPGKDREISRMIGELWNKLGEPEKSVYQEKGSKDKERYIKEMEEYREKMKGQVIDTAAAPIQKQLDTGIDIQMEDTNTKTDFEEGDSVPSQEHDSTSSESELEMQEMEVEKESEKDALTSEHVAPKPVNASTDACESQKQINKVEDVVYVHVPSTENKTDMSDKIGDAVDVQVLSSGNATELSDNIASETPIVKVEDAVDTQVTNSETVGNDGFGSQKQIEKVGDALAVVPSSANVTEGFKLQNQIDKVGNVVDGQVPSSEEATEGRDGLEPQKQVEKVGDGVDDVQVPSSKYVTDGGDLQKQIEKGGNAIDVHVPSSEHAREGSNGFKSPKRLKIDANVVDAQVVQRS